MSMLTYVKMAHGLLATIYGFGEFNCGSPKVPVRCDRYAITASGEQFDPALVTAAVAAPEKTRIRPYYLMLRIEKGRCHKVRINDKMNARYLGVRGFDLTPAAVRALTGKDPVRSWTGRVYLCSEKDNIWEKRLDLSRMGV